MVIFDLLMCMVLLVGGVALFSVAFAKPPTLVAIVMMMAGTLALARIIASPRDRLPIGDLIKIYSFRRTDSRPDRRKVASCWFRLAMAVQATALASFVPATLLTGSHKSLQGYFIAAGLLTTVAIVCLLIAVLGRIASLGGGPRRPGAG